MGTLPENNWEAEFISFLLLAFKNFFLVTLVMTLTYLSGNEGIWGWNQSDCKYALQDK